MNTTAKMISTITTLLVTTVAFNSAQARPGIVPMSNMKYAQVVATAEGEEAMGHLLISKNAESAHVVLTLNKDCSATRFCKENISVDVVVKAISVGQCNETIYHAESLAPFTNGVRKTITVVDRSTDTCQYLLPVYNSATLQSAEFDRGGNLRAVSSETFILDQLVIP
jgi:hypothetical protein